MRNALMLAGNEAKCRHCDGWHVLTHDGPDEGTPHARAMLYIRCHGKAYYIGQVGSLQRDDTVLRTPTASNG